MDIQTSVQTCFKKYAEFNGRALRSEYWWFALAVFLVSLVLTVISSTLSNLFSLATLLPSLAVGARRLHDTNRSGWWQLLWLIPIIGWIVMIVFLAQQGQDAENRFGAPPTE